MKLNMKVNMKKETKVNCIKVLVLLGIIVLMAIAIINISPVIKRLNTPEGQIVFRQTVKDAGTAGPLIIVGLQLAKFILTFIPGEPIEIVAGLCFGPVWGTIILFTTDVIITCGVYFLVRKYGRKVIYQFFKKEKVDKLENSEFFKDENKVELATIIMFLIPGTPKDLLLYVGGLLPMKPIKFILIATLLRLPSIISSAVAGNSMLHGDWHIFALAYLVTYIITIGILIVIKLIDKNKVTEDVMKSVKNKKTEPKVETKEEKE